MATDTPAFCRPGADPPRHALFRELRRCWLAAGEGRTSTQLAARFRVPLPHLSNWANASDQRVVPWWVIQDLCRELGLVVVLGPAGAWLMPATALPIADAEAVRA